MGCDIHVHTEVKIDGQWRHWGSPDVGRSYTLFEKMAGVRGGIANALVPPKGLPADATFETLFDYHRMEGDAHTPSWLGKEEIAALYDWWEVEYKETSWDTRWRWPEMQFGFLLGNSWEGLEKYPEEVDPRITDVRWVFWFDN